jgi:hypothetical protein
LTLVVLALTFSATGVVAASTGEFNSISEKMQLRAKRMAAAVDSGKLTQAEADSIWDKLNVATTQ